MKRETERSRRERGWVWTRRSEVEVLRNQVETPNLDPNPDAQFVAGLDLPRSLLKLELSAASGRRRNEAEGEKSEVK